MSLFPKPHEVQTHTQWCGFTRHLNSIIDKFPWDEKRDFIVLIKQIEHEYVILDNLRVEQRRHPREAIQFKIEEQKKNIIQYLTMLNNQLMFSKLSAF
jgi:hypothetical protein